MGNFQLFLILGGTFDPIHLGHIHIAREVMCKLELESVNLIPCYQSPLRVQPIAAASDRLTMTKLAAQEFPFLQVDAREIEKAEISYMADTLCSLYAEKGGQVALCLIVGIDAVADFKKWHKWQEILKLTHLIVVNRPGYLLIPDGGIRKLIEQHKAESANELRKEKSGKILMLEIEPIAISATEIRALIKAGKKITNFLPKSVVEYIKANKLYR